MAKKIEGRVALKTTKMLQVRDDGTTFVGDEKVYIEKGGKCRIHVDTPTFLPAVLVTYKLPREHDDVQWSEIDNRIYGTDPDAIEKARTTLIKAYVDRLKALDLQPVIVVLYKGTVRENTAEPGYGYQQAHMELSVFRLEFEEDKSPRGRYDTDKIRGTFYKWRESSKEALARVMISDRKDMRMFAYTEELWARVTDMRDRFQSGIAAMNDFIYADGLDQRLLAAQGPGLIMLPPSA